MALSIGDVLNTLDDPVVTRMNFWVGPVHISGRSYGVIRDHIRVGNIEVAAGSVSANAFYDNTTDVLITQDVPAPPDLDARGLLLHECTHALIDVFTSGGTVTRHIDELSGYLAQHAYLMNSNPAWVVSPNNAPWFNFFTAIAALITARGLHRNIGNGTRFTLTELEAVRVQLASLPGLNYHNYSKTDPSAANGLTRLNPFLDGVSEPIHIRETSVSHEVYPDPSDEYLIRTLQAPYAASDVAGYGRRLRELRHDFARCSRARAKALLARLSTKRTGDRVSQLFYERLSTEGRAILLRILQSR